MTKSQSGEMQSGPWFMVIRPVIFFYNVFGL